ncbi:hypothetical protein ACO0R3_003350 [Hanseniaspora guilliermondii]
MENSRRHSANNKIRTDLSSQLQFEENHQYENIHNITNDSFLKTNKRKYNENHIMSKHFDINIDEKQSIFYTKLEEQEDILLLKKPKLTTTSKIAFEDKSIIRKKYDDTFDQYKRCKANFEKDLLDSNVNEIFLSLLKICCNDHLLDKIPNLAYEHISFYNKALRIIKNKDIYKLMVIEKWIIDVFNQLTTPFDEITELYEILLIDFYCYNKKYIHHLKLIVIQLFILKNEQKDESVASLLKMFLYDKRFLFGFAENESQIQNVLKVLLHLMAVYNSKNNINLKFFFLSKMLEYCKSHKIDLNTYLKNQKLNTTQVRRLLTELICKKEVPEKYAFYIEGYLSKLGFKTDLKVDKYYDSVFISNQKWAIKFESSFKKQNMSIEFVDKLYGFYNFYINHISISGMIIDHKLQKSLHLLVKRLDKDIIYLCENFKSQDIFNKVQSIISNLIDIFINLNYEKGLLEILSTISFNLFVKKSNEDYLHNFLKVSFYIFYTSDRSEETYKRTLHRIIKSIQCILSMDMRRSLFRKIISYNSLSSNSSLSTASDFILKHLQTMHSILPLIDFSEPEFHKTSELMQALFMSGDIRYVTQNKTMLMKVSKSWSFLTKMLFQLISQESNILAIERVDEDLRPNSCLYNEKNFILCGFQFYKEMKKRSMLKLFKIGNFYMDMVLSIRAEEYQISCIEKEFLRNLFAYLKLNGFYQLVVEIFQKLKVHIEKKSHSNNANILSCLRPLYLNIRGMLLYFTYSNAENIVLNMFLSNIFGNKNKDTIDFDELNSQLEGVLNIKDLLTYQHSLNMEYPIIFDYNSSKFFKLSKALKIEVVFFNMNFNIKQGILLLQEGEGKYTEALQSFKSVLSLGKSLIKQSDSISQLIRIRTIDYIMTSFDHIIKIIIHMGNFQYYDYYIKEFDIILSSINEPVIRFKKYSLSIQYAALVFDQVMGFKESVVSSVDLNNSDIIFLEYCEKENLVKNVKESYEKNNLGMYKHVLNKHTNLLGSLKKVVDFRQQGLMDFHKIIKESIIEKSWKKTFYWEECYRTLGLTYERHLSENVTDYTNELSTLNDIATNNVVFNTNSRIIAFDFSMNTLLISIYEDDFDNELKIELPDRCILNFLEKLENIIERSNKSTSIETAKKVKSNDQKRQWWVTRYNLDSEMEKLLKSFDKACNFDHIFDQRVLNKNSELVKTLLDDFVERGIPANKFLIRLIHSTMDLKKIMRIYNKEIKLSELEYIKKKIEGCEDALEHEYLTINHNYFVLTDYFHNVPWESMPSFESMNITRLPSLSILMNLMSKYKEKDEWEISDNGISLILNPKKDLMRTEELFKPIFSGFSEDLKIVGRAPASEEFIKMASLNDLFIFIGHGNGIQYTTPKALKQLNSLSPALLLGCSSVRIHNTKSFYGYGSIMSFFLGGCPMVLGNLWDVTDKDIDLFTLSLFEKLNIVNKKENAENKRVDIACRESRNVCKLRYLNGAAPVVYGLPLKFS